jgi:hypothetical protein
MGTDRSVHSAHRNCAFLRRLWAPWDRVVSPHVFASWFSEECWLEDNTVYG